MDSPSDRTARLRICARRYVQRRRQGKPGWSDAGAYAEKQRLIERLLATGRVPAGARFLELGCGNGNITLLMAARGYEAHGIDIVPQAIAWAEEQARRRGLRAHFHLGSAVSLSEFADASFDFVFDGDCLIMILGADRTACVRNVHRILRPGGLFYARAHLLGEGPCRPVRFAGGECFDPRTQCSTVGGVPMYYYSRRDEFARLIRSPGLHIVARGETARPPGTDDMPFYAGGMWVEAVKPPRAAAGRRGQA